MKNLILACILLLFFTNCKNGETFEIAIITGFDNRECSCCGGFMLNFNSNPTPYQGEFKLADSFPPNVKIDVTDDFPIHVNVKWRFAEEACIDLSRIIIDEIELLE